MTRKPFSQLIIYVFAVVFSNPAFTQKKVFPGYYITLQGDSVKGVFPSYTQWSKNPTQVDFIAAGETKQNRLTPQNTRKFVIEGYDEYVSFIGRRLVNPIEDNVLLNDKSFVGRNDNYEDVTAFLRLVTATTGSNLYILNDSKRMNLFYQIPGQLITELRYKKTFDQNQVSEMAEYKQQLNNSFAEVIEQKKLTSSLEKLPYTEEDVSSFFQAMFPNVKTESRNTTTAAKWVISAGITVNMLSVQADNFFSAVPRTYGSSFSPLLSVGFILPVNRSFGKYFIYPQVKFFRYKNTGEETQGTFINSATYQCDFAAVIEMSGGANIVNRESFKFFASAGVGMLVQPNCKEIQQYYAASDHSPYGSAHETLLPNLCYSIDASVGVSLNKKILLSATYVLPSNIGGFVQYAPKLSGVQLRIGYMFP